MHEKLNKREVAVMLSMHIRNIIIGLKGTGFELLSSTEYVRVKCMGGERKFEKAQPVRYRELLVLLHKTVDRYRKDYGKVEIASDTMMEVLYRHGEHEFKTYFKLGERMFLNFYASFGGDDDREGESIALGDWIYMVICQELEADKFRKWILINQRNFNEKIINDR